MRRRPCRCSWCVGLRRARQRFNNPHYVVNGNEQPNLGQLITLADLDQFRTLLSEDRAVRLRRQVKDETKMKMTLPNDIKPLPVEPVRKPKKKRAA